MKNLITKEEKDRIDLICTEYRIRNYTINSDGSIDVDADADIDLSDRKLGKIPIKFNVVGGIFTCSENKLTSLDGGPTMVGSDFFCYENILSTLKGGPTTVGGLFDCYDNKLSTLEGSPTYVGGDFDCQFNKLSSTYSGDIDIEVVGDINIESNPLPKLILDHYEHIKLILKYQRHFFIWNDDLSLNIDNFADLIEEIKEGLQ